MNKKFGTLFISATFRVLSIGMIALCTHMTSLHAQDMIGIDDPMFFNAEQNVKQSIVKLPKAKANEITPLFWNAEEIDLINQIKMGLVQIDPINEYEIMGTAEEESKIIIENYLAPREILLSGILYNAEGDWVVWINGMRITPNKIPKEIRSINVAEGFVELKWFDIVTNKVYPVRIRPYQKFSIDLKTFLPGSTANYQR